MRISLPILALLGFAGGAPCQKSVAPAETPTVPQMKQMLDASQRRGQLEMEGGQPFHLVASYQQFDIFTGRRTGAGKIDEVWEDPHRYRQTWTVPAIQKSKPEGDWDSENYSLPPRQLVEVDNGTQAWRTGVWVIFGARGFDSVLQPFHWRSITTDRLSYETPPKGSVSLDCIGVEPDLPGVAEDTRLALTTYCLNKGSHLLRRILWPSGEEVVFNDVQQFGKKYVARTIEYAMHGQVEVRLHVDVLEDATDFSLLEEAPPEGAQLIGFHRADLPPLSGEFMRGQLLKKVSPLYPHGGLQGVVVVRIHVDTTGSVDSAEVLSAENQILKAPVLAAVKQWKFRVSYQGNKLMPATWVYNFHMGGEEAVQ